MEREELELELIKFNNFVDELEDVCGLTYFQIAFIKEVKYFNEIQGSFKFIKTHYVKKYEEVISEKQMMIEIDELIELTLIEKRLKKTIYNAKFVTTVTFITRLDINIGFWTGWSITSLTNMLPILNDEIEKLDNFNKRLAAIDIHMIKKNKNILA